MDDADILKAATLWYEEAKNSGELARLGFTSTHLDMLGATSSDTKEQIHLAIRLYNELLNLSSGFADSLMLSLIIATEDVEKVEDIEIPDYAALLKGHIPLIAPPELYITQRKAQLEPYVVEEYKKPIAQKQVRPPSGIVYCYYRCHRNDPADWYGSGFYFEHYPNGRISGAWSGS